MAAIASIPLRRRHNGDRLIWHFSRNGIYTVKSGYRLAIDLEGCKGERLPGEWATLWKLQVPPKVKAFLWRACQNILPTRAKLAQKRIEVPTECVMCRSGTEDLFYVFLDCNFSR